MQKQHSIYTPVILTLIILAHYLFSSISLTVAAGHTNDEPVSSESKLDQLDQELAWLYAEADYVSIATKSRQKVSDAPSIITVITADEIDKLGARTLTDILITVPGIDVIRDASFGEFDIGGRGLRLSSEKIKILVDGHSINMPFTGNAITFFDDLSLKNVKKIEIIRGPGSAIYGANAFLAVINVITKDAKDIDGVKISSGFGSFDTMNSNVLFGNELYGVDISGFAGFYNTNGISETIKEDSISGVPFVNQFSLAPNDTDDGRNKLDLNLKLSYKNIDFKARYMNKDAEPFVGPSFIITDDSDQHYNFVMGELSYSFDLGERLSVHPRIYYDQYDMDLDLEAVPDGFTIPIDTDRDGDVENFPEGMLGRAVATNRVLGGAVQFDYQLFDNNMLTFGSDYEWQRQDNVTYHTNFDPVTNASLGAVRDVSDTNWIREVYRQIWAVYLQDKWDITDEFSVTIGIRHDHYSDFEGTTNPRIGFVWNFMENATLKALYGQAFRAPNFEELYTTNNPVFAGNPNLKPELIRTYELGLGYKFTKAFDVNVNYFFNVIRDQIGFRPKTSPSDPQLLDNLGNSNVQGVELELKADIGNNAYAFANYTYLDAESKGDPLPDVPKHKGNIGFNYSFGKYLNANLHTFISDDRVREEKDGRDDSPGYALVNLTLIAKEFFKTIEIKASLFNLLDKNYEDPAPINTIPTDLPRPGRTFFIELGYKF